MTETSGYTRRSFSSSGLNRSYSGKHIEKISLAQPLTPIPSVPKIYIGYRSADGILQNIEELDTQKIPSNIQRMGLFKWDGNLCINFTSAFLAFLKETIVGEGVWRIRRTAKDGAIEVFKVEETGTGSILKQSFLDWRAQMTP